jgi:hypothetical protein
MPTVADFHSVNETTKNFLQTAFITTTVCAPQVAIYPRMNDAPEQGAIGSVTIASK